MKAIARSSIEQSVGEVLRILVGRWSDVRKDIAARTLETGPSASGRVRPPEPSGDRIALLDSQGRSSKHARPGVRARRGHDVRRTSARPG